MKQITYREKIINNKSGSLLYCVEIKNSIHETSMHWHNQFEIVEFLCEGTLWLANKKTEFKEGDYLIIGSLQPNKISGKGISNFTALLIDTQFIKSDDASFISKMTSFTQKLTKVAFVISSGGGYEEFISIYKELFAIHKRKEYIFSELSVCFKMFSYIEEKFITDVQTAAGEEKIKDIISYIADNYSDNITLKMLSEKFNIEKFSLINRFKHYTGLTPIQYIINIRLQNAYYLLKNGMSVTDTALSCGFDNMSYFTSSFCKKYNICPKNVKTT